MACAAPLVSTKVIEEKNLNDWALHLGDLALKPMRKMEQEHPITGDVRTKYCLWASRW